MDNLTLEEKRICNNFLSSYSFITDDLKEQIKKVLYEIISYTITHGEINLPGNTEFDSFSVPSDNEITFYYKKNKKYWKSGAFWSQELTFESLAFLLKHNVIYSYTYDVDFCDLPEDRIFLNDRFTKRSPEFKRMLEAIYQGKESEVDYCLMVMNNNFYLLKHIYEGISNLQKPHSVDKYANGPIFDEEASVLTYKNGLSHSFTETDERYEADSPRIRSPLFKLLWKNREIQRNGISDSEKSFISYQKIAEVCSLSWESNKKADTSRTIRETVGKVNKILQKKGFPIDMKCKKGAKIVITL